MFMGGFVAQIMFALLGSMCDVEREVASELDGNEKKTLNTSDKSALEPRLTVLVFILYQCCGDENG